MSGDPHFQTDMAIFHATRSLEGSVRWTLAQSDDNLSLAGLLHAFRCALGLTLTPDDAPKLIVLLTRANSTHIRRPACSRSDTNTSVRSRLPKVAYAFRHLVKQRWNEVPIIRRATQC
jgi:hypothetical protein